jgi:hypothetical protein
MCGLKNYLNNLVESPPTNCKHLLQGYNSSFLQHKKAKLRFYSQTNLILFEKVTIKKSSKVMNAMIPITPICPNCQQIAIHPHLALSCI